MSTTFIRAAAAAFTTLALSIGPAFASGSHSGGHDDGHDDAGHHGTNGHHADGIGMPGDPAKADRTVPIRMGEMFFEPGSLSVKKGETIRFVVKNEGEFVHEFNIATESMHMAHADEMIEMMERGYVEADRINHQMMKDNGMMHDDPNSLLLAPGESGEFTWTFSEEVELQMSCNVPGHREGGMLGHIHIGH